MEPIGHEYEGSEAVETCGRSPALASATVNGGKVDADEQAGKTVKSGVGALRRGSAPEQLAHERNVATASELT